MDEVIREFIGLDSSSPSGLVWIKYKKGMRVKVGSPAMASLHKSGYYAGGICGKAFLAHRVVFFLVHGYWPENVDHIDGVRTNNSVANLRAVSRVENCHNRRTAKGYSFHKRQQTWNAYIQVNNKLMQLGSFKTEEEARAAYLAAKKIHHPTSPINKET